VFYRYPGAQDFGTLFTFEPWAFRRRHLGDLTRPEWASYDITNCSAVCRVVFAAISSWVVFGAAAAVCVPALVRSRHEQRRLMLRRRPPSLSRQSVAALALVLALVALVFRATIPADCGWGSFATANPASGQSFTCLQLYSNQAVLWRATPPTVMSTLTIWPRAPQWQTVYDTWAFLRIETENTGWRICLPYWLVSALGFAACFLLMFRIRRRPPAGQCECGYNLTGNVSGRCPECGTPVPQASGGAAG
jgi:hypothetical protein